MIMLESVDALDSAALAERDDPGTEHIVPMTCFMFRCSVAGPAPEHLEKAQ